MKNDLEGALLKEREKGGNQRNHVALLHIGSGIVS